MPRYVVEREFPQPLTDEEMNETARKLDECLPAHNAVWKGSVVSIDRTRMICQFDAPGSEEVKNANRSAGAVFKRVWEAEPHDP